MHAFRIVSSALVVALFALTSIVAAQNVSLEGRVVDPDRAAVVGVPIVLTHVPFGNRQTSQTRDDGTFRFTAPAPGLYRLEITAPGFNAYIQEITLGASNRTVEAALQIAGVREDITVQVVATVATIGRVNTPLRDQPLTVNTLTSEFIQSHAIGAYLAWNGSHLGLAWCDNTDGGQHEIYFQRFDAAGKAAGGPRRLTHNPTSSRIPAIQPWRDGFALAWNEFTPDPRDIHGPDGRSEVMFTLVPASSR